MKSNNKNLRRITNTDKINSMIPQESQEYRFLFDHAPVGVVELDYSQIKKYLDSLESKGKNDLRKYFWDNPNEVLPCLQMTKVIMVNQEILDEYGVSSDEELLMVANRTIRSNLKQIRKYGDMLASFAEGKNRYCGEPTIVTYKGETKYLHEEGSVIPDSQKTWNRVIFTSVSLPHIHERETLLKFNQKKLEDMLRKQKYLYELELKSCQQMKKEMKTMAVFSRALVHELKTPLTPMIACSGAIANGIQEEPWKSLAEQVHRGATNLGNRINDLLDLKKDELGVLRLSCELVEPNSWLREIYELFSPMAFQQGKTLILHIPFRLPSIWVDAERLRQVVINLMDNAFKFTTRQGEIRVVARVENFSLLIEVQDNGIGMTPQQQAKIFNPCKRVECDRGRLSGVGLGLALSKTLVELHGGRIWLKSENGKGCCVSIAIPLDRALMQDDAKAGEMP